MKRDSYTWDCCTQRRLASAKPYRIYSTSALHRPHRVASNLLRDSRFNMRTCPHDETDQCINSLLLAKILYSFLLPKFFIQKNTTDVFTLSTIIYDLFLLKILRDGFSFYDSLTYQIFYAFFLF